MEKQKKKVCLKKLQVLLGVSFHDINLLKKAVTHSSFEGGGAGSGNERLEFLGDAVLKLICAWYFYGKHPVLSEGELSAIIGQIVSEKSLALVAARLGLSKFLIVSDNLKSVGGHKLPSLLADAFEAVIGAIFIDNGFDAAQDFIIDKLQLDMIDPESFLKQESFRNYKADLQELFQKKEKSLPEYRVIKEEGPDHNKTFTVSVYFKNKKIGMGIGKTKKDAEQAAAQDGLNHKLF